MGNSSAHFSQTIVHGLEKYALYHKKYPTARTWVHFFKYIVFSSKPAIYIIEK